MKDWTEKKQRSLGWYYFVVALIAIVIAVVVQPTSGWETFTFVMAGALAMLGLVGLYMALTGKGNTRSRDMDPKRQRTVGIIGLIFVSVAVLVSLVSDTGAFTASDTITVGIWVALSGLFVSQIATIGKDS
jgi:membrane associated rhomboid family serine protease